MKSLSTPEQHQKNVALKTLKMPDAMVGVMGGMDKDEARKFLKSIGYTDAQVRKLEASQASSRVAIASELLKVARELASADGAVVKAAVSSHVKGVVAGVTSSGKVIIFMSRDYDNKGNVTGPVEDVTHVAGKNGFYLLYMSYDDDTLKKLGLTESQKDKLISLAKKFAAKHSKAVKTAALGKSEIVSLASIMKNTGVSKNERFVTALVGWLSDRNPAFDEDKFRAALE